MSVRPKKHLGQHFLWDKNIARKIVEAFQEAPSPQVLEVGPGKGVLTQYLLEHFGSKLYAVEIDRESAQHLLEAYPELRDYLIQQDFLQMNFSRYFEGNFDVIGNFPYNISSQIFFRLLEYRHQIPFLVGMVQKEVADRIASPPGSKTYGKLSVMLQAFYEVKVVFQVGPQSFTPPPKVNSAVVRLRRNQTEQLECDEKLFFQVVKQSFNQRRKTIRNSLKSFLLPLNVEDDRLSKRPEQLSVQDFVELTGKISAATGKT
jgi:16S rRNA (adenine1518-N6/adenine1519-N6)-dimethyltransferase